MNRCSICQQGDCQHCPELKRQNQHRQGQKQRCRGQRPGLRVEERQLIYEYAGSFAGLLCCVYESVYSHELPLSIETAEQAQPSLLPKKLIATNSDRAERVYQSIPTQISPSALRLVKNVFLSAMPQKELSILRFLLFAYDRGGSALDMLGHAAVAPLLAAEKQLLSEAQLLKGFIRFSDYGKVLAATISPKNFVLPHLARHFTARFPNENFMIYDQSHQAAFIYHQGQQELISLEGLALPPVPPQEQEYRSLWQGFYQAISIQSRHNPLCRRTHMPKRYWQHMTEMQSEL